ncbi:MFS transporter [Candidatus Kaiserbacteria bacterium]|nr:MFS transporter [Candidatus Kaiserbacteria bacterium]
MNFGAFFNHTFASLKIRNYRLYFIGQAISLSGTWMQIIALGWLTLEVTGSGSQLGLVIAVQYVPILLFGFWGGMIADRFDKRRILILTQAGLGLVALSMSIVVFAGIIRPWMLFSFAVCWGIIRIFDNPTRLTFVFEMVDASHIKNAVSLNATENNLARAIGPSIGGVLIATTGIAFCFFFNAVTYIAVIAMLFFMREHELHRSPPIARKPGQLREGLRYIMETPRIRDVLIVIAVIGTFAYEFQVSLPLFAQQTFLAGASAYAALMASFGVGAAIGGLYAASRHTVAPRQFLISGFLFGASIIGTSLAPTLPIAIIGMVFIGIFATNVTSIGNTMIQLESIPQMRGRVMALWEIAMIGSTPIGGPIIGWIGQNIGARWAIATGGIATVSAIILGSRRLLKKVAMQEIPTDVKIGEEEMNIANSQ